MTALQSLLGEKGRTALETSERGRGGAAPTKWGAGRSPASIEGGWVGPSRAACSSGMGVWGAAPPQREGGAASGACGLLRDGAEEALGVLAEREAAVD